MTDIWSVPPTTVQFPKQTSPGDGIGALLARIKDMQRQLDESTANLLRTAGVSLTPTGMKLTLVPVYANNAAAITGGLVAGSLYRTGVDPDLLCIVH